MEETAKEKFFKAVDRIEELKTKNSLTGLTEAEDRELRNLEVMKGQYYSEWKD